MDAVISRVRFLPMTVRGGGELCTPHTHQSSSRIKRRGGGRAAAMLMTSQVLLTRRHYTIHGALTRRKYETHAHWLTGYVQYVVLVVVASLGFSSCIDRREAEKQSSVFDYPFLYATRSRRVGVRWAFLNTRW